MDLMPAEEIFEVNSNSTTDTLKEQRLARNKELRLKATYLVSRRPIKNQQKEYNSESSSEFPASSPSNPQMQRKSQYQTRPPLLKNTLPADSFERGLTLIATKEPQMTMSEKIESWQCATDEFSDVEDVVNFDAAFEKREENVMKLFSKTKHELKNKSKKDNNSANQLATDTCYSFTEFQRRLLAIDPRKVNLPEMEQKHNSKLTSEEDEKPTTSSNCLARNRDTPLKKRTCKYKRAAEPMVHLPNKKSSSSDTPRDGAPSPKKKVQQKISAAAAATGEGARLFNEKMICLSSSETSSHLVKNDNANTGTYTRNSRSQFKSKPTKIIETNSFKNNWNRAISSTNKTKKDERESFFRWRRLSREIDKLEKPRDAKQKLYQQGQSQTNSQPKESQGLIQIRYDFLDPNNISKTNSKKSSYNVVVKPLIKEEHNNKTTPYARYKSPSKETKSESTQKQTISNCEESIKTEHLKENKSVNIIQQDLGLDSGIEFHQQHEFCNYLGLTGMSTANAMASAAAELSKCNLTRRSLRVRNLEQRKAKSKNKSETVPKRNERIAKDTLKRSADAIPNSTVTSNQKSDEHFDEKSQISSKGTANTREETKKCKSIETAYPVSIQLAPKAKETEAKIKILCQMSNLHNKHDIRSIEQCTEELTKPELCTMKQQHKEEKLLSEPNSNNIEYNKDDKKYIKLLTMAPNKITSNKSPMEQTEVQTLHEKVQKCLQESRQNTPNIFIVQALDSSPANRYAKNLDMSEQSFDAIMTANSGCNNCKISIQSNTSNQVKHTKNMNVKKRKMRGNIKRSIARSRKLYTRSMLNLNQQRELRNRKVILKILKTYTNLKIKVSKSKAKRDAEQNRGNQSNNNANGQKDNLKAKLPDKDCDTNKTSFALNSVLVTPKLSEDSITAHANVLQKDTLVNEKKEAVLNNEIVNPNKKHDHDFLISSNILKSKTEAIIMTNSDNEYEAATEKTGHVEMTEVAVQTDPMSPTQSFTILTESRCQIQDTIKVRNINGEMDVSSSDVVTSTTNGVGDLSRCDPKTSPSSSNLVTKETLGNFLAGESIINTNPPKVEENLADRTNELSHQTNVSINFSINDLGIHALYGPNKTFRNPLQEKNGPVLHIFFELDTLIVIQESLISFWKYIRVLNALITNPCEINTGKIRSNVNRSELQPLEKFQSSDCNYNASTFANGCEWIFLGEKKRAVSDIEIKSCYMNRLCLSESRPVYVEMRCRELINEFRECNLLSCYVNVYFFNEEDQVAVCHSIQLDSIQSIPSDIIYTTINDSRYFVLAWPQANVLGKVRSGICKYALTPELDMLATTRDFKAMRHVLRSLECLNDGKLLGFGDTQLTVWDHRSGDILMNYDLSLPLGRNLGTIYYPSFENGQNNIIILIQHEHSESSSDLLIIACTMSHANPSRRVIRRYKLPTPTFLNIRNGVNNGEHFIIQSDTGEEIIMSCNDPHQLIFVPVQEPVHFYTRGRSQIIELTKQTLTVDSFSNYLLRIATNLNAQTHKNSESWCV